MACSENSYFIPLYFSNSSRIMEEPTQITSEVKFYNSRFLKPDTLNPREYQSTISDRTALKNSLVVIPTGLGKTIIALLTAVKILEKSPDGSKIIILAPTRPLINQHYEVFKNLMNLPEEKFAFLIGATTPKKRAKAFLEAQILFFTPETLRNDVLESRYSLSEVCLIVFDEAHRASGNYAYCSVAEQYALQNKDGRSLALTASPGSNKEAIEKLCSNLHIDSCSVHIRDRSDADVKK